MENRMKERGGGKSHTGSRKRGCEINNNNNFLRYHDGEGGRSIAQTWSSTHSKSSYTAVDK